MEKKKVGARESVTDIRSGMSDAALVEKYHLSPPGLQSLFDKLVGGGYIDLSEIHQRKPEYLGLVDISRAFPQPEKYETEDFRQTLRPGLQVQVNAQEVARDIRSGMADSALMDKYKLSSRGLQSLFNKLKALKLVQQIDLDRRGLEMDHTVDLKEDLRTFATAYRLWGDRQPDHHTADAVFEPVEIPPAPADKTKVERQAVTAEKRDTRPQQPIQDKRVIESAWYDQSWIVISLLIVLFPLGLYACYRNSTLSTGIKAFAIVACTLLVIICVTLIFSLTWPLSELTSF
jgi:hypothetical protein